ncbi:Mitochondrial import inner membrane translocase subunit tim22 [Apiotrichum porosum]|uniref:Mitochondrial import inner membrane translocase subunit TIM22 n=1 Tax=Apiotrichum porosum TaxID=105984 RepID=A0A427XZ90_9TREE|nr:Mitochondrial import inner membrane translocase subunit tim22 [Apiotrichum porosum]RSH84141.1 Mitochondrial import inner membrane translocase subunit tim22 [Apiotrichum porosum]
MSGSHPLMAPVYLPGSEPYPPGTTEEEKDGYRQMVKWNKYGGYAMESCALKVVLAGGAGFAFGGFLSLMSATFAYEDPLSRASEKLTGTRAQAAYMFKEMGRNMWSQGKGFAKVGMLYSGVECCIEGYRAKNDHWNGLSAGFVSGAILARNAGPMAMLGGGAAFAAFSAAIDMYLRREPADDD